MNANHSVGKMNLEERIFSFGSFGNQKCEPGPGLFPGAWCPGRAGILGFPDWPGNDRQDRSRHRHSSTSCSGMVVVRSTASDVASERRLSLASGSDLLR